MGPAFSHSGPKMNMSMVLTAIRNYFGANYESSTSVRTDRQNLDHPLPYRVNRYNTKWVRSLLANNVGVYAPPRVDSIKRTSF